MTNSVRTVPAGMSVAARLTAGQGIKLVNTHGTQVVDCWAFNLPDTHEFMSMEHTRVELGRVVPRVGDHLFTNRRRPILTLMADTSPGVHDTTLAACDVHRYQRLGHQGYHGNCTDNLRSTMREEGLVLPSVPCPLNFWENAPILSDGTQQIRPPVSKKGDHVLIRADTEVVIVLSACPQDMAPTNGIDAVPMEAHYTIEASLER